MHCLRESELPETTMLLPQQLRPPYRNPVHGAPLRRQRQTPAINQSCRCGHFAYAFAHTK